ncbi:tryptophan 2,3-dioxygenase-like [Paramacrobiotus metropolitanus]|uniref:tryptophan 2,3-dioxygenase-like n=1 Tax=Paramacrobiotus metropolitanus TaxID=2943436 RepID=UPI0024461274|nr:tryptophan 2,3-dioxygenase-like [Paramacrobiotus metropolitanus]
MLTTAKISLTKNDVADRAAKTDRICILHHTGDRSINNKEDGQCPFGRNGSVTNGIVGRDYGEYLRLDSLLSNVDMMSARYLPEPVHDEHLFITTHQTQEMWFKQILFEIDSIRDTFPERDSLDDRQCTTISQRLHRISVIWNVLIEHFTILQTMQPVDFMRFRHLLAPGSGFQSLQFRLIECKLGLTMKQRGNPTAVCGAFSPPMQSTLTKAISEPSVLDLVNQWLDNMDTADFAAQYTEAVREYLSDEQQQFDQEPDAHRREMLSRNLAQQKQVFEVVLDRSKYEEEVQTKKRRMSYNAFMSALKITFYRTEQRFQSAYAILTALVDIDSAMSKWRFAHITTAQRMLGSKSGPYSSGYLYLRSTIGDRYKIFLDLINVSSHLLPEPYIPPLSFHRNGTLFPRPVNDVLLAGKQI